MRSKQNRDEDDAIIKRSEEVYKIFLAELEKRGHTVYKEWSHGGDGRYRISELGGISFDISLHPEPNRSSWYRIYKDKLRIQVGHWEDGRRKQFPEPKKGFDWKKIIDYLEEYMQQRSVRLAAEDCKRANLKEASVTVDGINKTYKMKRIRLRALEHVMEPRISIDLDYLNPDSAERVVKLLIEELPDIFKGD